MLSHVRLRRLLPDHRIYGTYYLIDTHSDLLDTPIRFYPTFGECNHRFVEAHEMAGHLFDNFFEVSHALNVHVFIVPITALAASTARAADSVASEWSGPCPAHHSIYER